jgi:hypothetical protein
MSDQYAIVENGVVSNVVQWDGDASIWQAPEGAAAIALSGDSVVGIGYAYDGEKFDAPPGAPETLAQAQASQIAEISTACQSAIYAGFTSGALGAAYNYPAKATDQQNLASSVLASLMPGNPPDWATPFWCSDASGSWAFRAHTAAEIQKVGQDAKAAVLAAMTKNQILSAEVAAASTVDAVNAIVWG